MMTNNIDSKTKAYSQARDLLVQRVQDLNDQVELLKRRRLAGIKSAAEQLAAMTDELATEIKHHPEQFEKPRTRVIFGIKVGLQKGKEELLFANENRVIELVKAVLPDRQEVLINTKESLHIPSVKSLPDEDLQRIGITRKDGKDQVVIKGLETDIDKLVGTWLKELSKEFGQAENA